MALAYCLISDVENRLSADGVTYRSDDTPPTAYGDVIDDASRTIDEYCLLSYSDTNLAASGWIKHRCADIATFLLCERRGNPVPVGIAQKYERAIEKLEKVRLGRLLIPDIAARKDAVPVLSNVHIRQDYAGNRTVVERARSTGQAEGYKQRVDLTDPLEWFDPGI